MKPASPVSSGALVVAPAERDHGRKRSQAEQGIERVASAPIAEPEIPECEWNCDDDQDEPEDGQEWNREDRESDQQVGTHSTTRRYWARILALCLAAASGLVHITAQAAAPTVAANGSTQALSAFITANFQFASNTGSPTAGELAVQAVDCYDLTNSNNTVLSTPSGWTQVFHRQAGDSFGDHAVYYKIATGSEGATVTFTVQNNSTECSSWYWRVTGHQTSAPIECTDSAWATSLTFDPPSQTFLGGPRDGLVFAAAHTRGDNTYTSGPGGLSTTAQDANPGIAAGRSIAVGWQGFTATSSVDPTTVTFAGGGGAHIGSTLSCVVYAPLSGGQGQLFSGPTKRLLRGKL